MNCESCGVPLAEAARFCSACGAPVRRTVPAGDPLREELQRALPSNLQIVRPLGRGGMGAVYLARDEYLDREVAIKTLPADLGSDDALRDRFRREARIAAKLHHPNIVPLHTFGEGERVLYYVMGFVRGETLAQRLQRDGVLDSVDAQRILIEIAAALRHAHAQGVIHRDLKPENILLDDVTGTAVLADFGIARVFSGGGLTRAGAVLGTPLYMAPEQASGSTVDHRADIYALGVIGYRMLTGRLPVEGETLNELLAQHVTRVPAPVTQLNPSVPQDLNDAVMRCLEKNPNARWQNVADFTAAISTQEPSIEGAPQMQSVAFYAILLLTPAVLMLPYELFFWTEIDPGWRLLIQVLQVVPAFAVAIALLRIVEARLKQKMTWRAIWRSVLHPPRWYWGWMPRALRPPNDKWDSLPAIVRLHRHWMTLTVVYMFSTMVLMPLFILSASHPMLGRVFSITFLGCLLPTIAISVAGELTLMRRRLDATTRTNLMFKAAWLLRTTTIPASDTPTQREASTEEATVAKG